MTADDPQHPERVDFDALAEALHRALERAGSDDLLPEGEDREDLDGALETAGLLDRFVRYVEEGSGIGLVPDGPAATAAGEGDGDSLPQPFPGEYLVRGVLGRGAFGEVWLADDLKLGVPVAVKRVRPGGDVERRSRALVALENDAHKLARVRHPNVVQVYGWRQAGGEHYLMMQFVPGRSLQARLAAEGPLPWRLAARYAADAAEALLHVHAAGIVHRDVSPANLLWDEERDEVLLTDFGLAAWLAEAGAGEAAGAPLYMAPEALRGRGGLAADVYGLAATLFHLAVGETPFPARSRPELEAQAERGLPDDDPRCAVLPAGLERVVRAGLTADPRRRPTLGEFAEGLRGCLNQLLADSLARPGLPGAGPARAVVRLTVSRRGSDGGYTTLAAAQRELPLRTRNMEVMPPEPEGMVMRTGDRVRIEAVAGLDGYLTVFNVGPGGVLSLLYPGRSALGSPGRVRADEPVVIAEVRATPPAGSERLFAVWSREPLESRLEEVAREARHGPPVSAAYRATRNLVLVEESVRQLRGEDWQAAVVELDHRPV